MRNLRSLLPVAKTEAGSEYDGPGSTYTEWHAALIGFGIAAATIGATAFGVATGIPPGVAWLKAAYYAVAGKRLQVPGFGGQLGILKRYLGQIHREPHYFYGGSVIGGVTGYVAVYAPGVVP